MTQSWVFFVNVMVEEFMLEAGRCEEKGPLSQHEEGLPIDLNYSCINCVTVSTESAYKMTRLSILKAVCLQNVENPQYEQIKSVKTWLTEYYNLFDAVQ